MKMKIVVALIAGFLIGDLEACIRANRSWKKELDSRDDANSVAQEKADLFDALAADFNAGLTPQEATMKHIGNRHFKNIINMN